MRHTLDKKDFGVNIHLNHLAAACLWVRTNCISF